MPNGGFRNPWRDTNEDWRPGGVLRWQWERWRSGNLPRLPGSDAFPRATPAIANPRAAHDEMRLTWVGHSTYLLQIGSLNILTDPVWSDRASPVSWSGPRRVVGPVPEFEALPPIDAVLVSHDHYDHLDAPTVRRLHARFGGRIRWITPLGYRSWFRSFGADTLDELDWGDATIVGDGSARVTIRATPARHWTRRRPFVRSRRLWASFVIEGSAGNIYFAGDSGYFPGYAEIGEAHGPFDALIMPIGAYEPRWFMRPMHMNPAEAVQAYRELGSSGTFLPMHWGTFILTDEPALDPPLRLREAWQAAGLPAADLRVLQHGETFVRGTVADDPAQQAPRTP